MFLVDTKVLKSIVIFVISKMNKRKSLFIIVPLGIFLGLMLMAFNVIDFSETEYLLKGKIYFNNKPLKNDSVYFVNIYPGEKASKANTQIIKTDTNGNYERRIRCTGYCMSGNYKECKGLTRDECFFVMSKHINADSLIFYYNKKRIAIKNKYVDALTYLKNNHYDNQQQLTFEQDIQFK